MVIAGNVSNNQKVAQKRVRFKLPTSEDNVLTEFRRGDVIIPPRETWLLGPAYVSRRFYNCDGSCSGDFQPICAIPSPHVVVYNQVTVARFSSKNTQNHPTDSRISSILSSSSNVAPRAVASLDGELFLRAARDGDYVQLSDYLKRATVSGITDTNLNATDSTGRTILSYAVSNGPEEILEKILQLPGLDYNKADNEGNTPLHFAAQAGQVESLNYMLSKCRDIHIDARNHLGFTPLMKAALQGRNKCAKILLCAGANPTLRDYGKGFRADQWAKHCGRYTCANVIEKHAGQSFLEKSACYDRWGVENAVGSRILLGKMVPVPQISSQSSYGFRSKLKKVFRSASNSVNSDSVTIARLATQLTSAALCASTPVLPAAATVAVAAKKSVIRPLTVPRLQVTLIGSNSNETYLSNNNSVTSREKMEVHRETSVPVIKPRTKKKQ